MLAENRIAPPAPKPAREAGLGVAEQLRPRVFVFRWGGIDRSPHVVTLLNFLAQQKFRTTLATVEAGVRPGSLSRSVGLLSLGRNSLSGRSKLLRMFGIAWQFRKTVRSYGADILYVIDSWTLPVVLLGALGGRLAPAFVYHTFDWLDPALYRTIRTIHLWYERWACLRADLCVNVDRSRTRMMQSFYGLPTAPLWIPNFPERQARAPQRDEGLRAELLGPRGRFLMVCPSRLHLELMRATALLPEYYRLLTFRGAGAYAEQCVRFVESSRLGGRVTFLEPCAYEELARYVLCADVGIILNDWKRSSGYYMANSGRLANFLWASVPVVVSDVPNLEALVYKWRLGESCDAYEPASIAESIRKTVEGAPGIEERRLAVRRAFQEELHFERRGMLLASEMARLCRVNVGQGQDLKAPAEVRVYSS